MQAKTIQALRDLALQYEKTNLKVAYELMSIAHKESPGGKLIEAKVSEYMARLGLSKPNEELLALLNAGDVAVIPIGFRCFTKGMIEDKLGFTQASLPFDSGFFSPHSVANVFKNRKVSMSYHDTQTHTVCKKFERVSEPNLGEGIRFETSTYEEINEIVKDKDISDIKNYLDSTFGYYTLDKENAYVLAHYNWHKFANEKKSNGVRDPEKNIPLINSLLNKRISRMFDICSRAKYVFFVYLNRSCHYLKIDDVVYDLKDFSSLEKTLTDNYDFKFSIVDIHKETGDSLLNRLKY